MKPHPRRTALLLALTLGLSLSATGCAKTLTRLCRLTPNSFGKLCKHCNCIMPEGIAPDAPCTACNCGYPAGKCS